MKEKETLYPVSNGVDCPRCIGNGVVVVDSVYMKATTLCPDCNGVGTELVMVDAFGQAKLNLGV